jgi:hypothetical protein
MSSGIYTLANDATLDWFIAFCESVRRHDPDMPLVVIPYDARVRRLSRLAARYRFDVLTEEELAPLDAIGRAISPDELPGTFRKLAVFWGSLSPFIYLDADLVTVASVRPAIEAISRDVADLLIFDADASQVYTPALQARFPHSAHFNSGAFASRSGLVSPARIDALSAEAVALRSQFAIVGEQPFLNLCADVEGWRVRHARQVIPAGHVWAGWPASEHRPFIHWAGFHLNPLMPQRRRYLEYRLAGAGRRERLRFLADWTLASARDPVRLALTVRNRVRAARRWRAGEAVTGS